MLNLRREQDGWLEAKLQSLALCDESIIIILIDVLASHDMNLIVALEDNSQILLAVQLFSKMNFPKIDPSYPNPSSYFLKQSSDESNCHQETTGFVSASSTKEWDSAVLWSVGVC
jgi:hypothetical protein